jgi:hypothetical protein
MYHVGFVRQRRGASMRQQQLTADEYDSSVKREPEALVISVLHWSGSMSVAG